MKFSAFLRCSIIAFIFLTLCEAGFGQVPDCVWARPFGDAVTHSGNSIVTDGKGNTFVAGDFRQPFLTFDSFTLVNKGMQQGFFTIDIFFVKFDGAGRAIWAKSFGGDITTESVQTILYNNGNLYLSAYFTGDSVVFGDHVVYNSHPFSKETDIVIVKFDSDGNALWARSPEGGVHEKELKLAADPQGNIYIAGNFESSTLTFGTTVLDSIGRADVFIAKYSPDGQVLWATSAGTLNYDYPPVIATDSSGNLYLGGSFANSHLFCGSYTLEIGVNFWWYQLFIMKFDSSGNVLWGREAGGYESEMISGIATDNRGDVYLTGYYNSDSLTFGNSTVVNGGSSDMFVVKYDAEGNGLWVQSSEGKGTARGYSYDAVDAIATDSLGNVYVAGMFSSATLTFGATVITNTNRAHDIFLVKFDSQGKAHWASALHGANEEKCKSLTVDTKGDVYISGYFLSDTLSIGSKRVKMGEFNRYKIEMFAAKLSAGATGIHLSGHERGDKMSLFVEEERTLRIRGRTSPATELSIFSMTGESIQQHTLPFFTSAVDLSYLPNGVYVYKLKGKGDFIQTGSFILD